VDWCSLILVGKITTRYETIRLAAEAAGRTFVINARLAYILNKLGEIRVPDGCSFEECEKLYNRIDRLHVSGCASKPEIKEIMDKIQPQTLIPIHTQNPKAFIELAKEVETNIKVMIPEMEKPYKI